MRVLLVSHTCQSSTEGQPRAVELAKREGIELCVLVPVRWKHYGTWRTPEVPSTAAFRFEVGRVRWPWVPGAQCYLHHYPNFGALLREFKPDVIDLWEEPWSLVSAQACLWRNRYAPKARIVAETEQNILKTLPPPFEFLRRIVHRNADYLIGRSAEAVEVSRRKGYRGPVAAVPNGVDAELFRPMNRKACREELLGRGAGSRFIAGYVGRLVPEKGLAEMIECLPECGESVDLLFVGSGPMEGWLRERAAQLGMAERVRFLPQQRLEALPKVMNALDALVLVSRTTPSWKEQFGRVIIEAHAAGTPVIGSDSGAIPSVVGCGGLIVSEGNTRDLAAAIRRMAGEPERCVEMAREGRRRALSECSWPAIAERMERIYREVCRRSLSRFGTRSAQQELELA